MCLEDHHSAPGHEFPYVGIVVFQRIFNIFEWVHIGHAVQLQGTLGSDASSLRIDKNKTNQSRPGSGEVPCRPTLVSDLLEENRWVPHLTRAHGTTSGSFCLKC